MDSVERHVSRAENFGVAVGWPLVSFAAFVVLHWSSTRTVVAGPGQPACCFGGAFFGVLAIDLGVALGRGVARRRGATVGNYSSMMAFSVILMVMWWISTGTTDAGWVGNFGAVAAVSAVALGTQIGLFVLVTRRLGPPGRTQAPTTTA